MRGINILLLEKRHKFFTRTLISSMTTIARHNPVAAELLTDVGEVSKRIRDLIDFVKEQDSLIITPPPKPKKGK